MKKFWSIVLVLVMLASAAALPALAATGGTVGIENTDCLNGKHTYVCVGTSSDWVDGGAVCEKWLYENYKCNYCSANYSVPITLIDSYNHVFHEEIDKYGVAWQVCSRCDHKESF